MSSLRAKYKILRSYAIADKMCFVQNVHTCQCHGSIEPAFTPQDVRSCMCPTIVRMHGLRHKCDPCRRQQKRQGKRKSLRRNESRKDMTETMHGAGPQEIVGTVGGQDCSSRSVGSHTHTYISEATDIDRPPLQNQPSEMCQKRREVLLERSEVFTSSSWNIGRPHGTPRMCRLVLSGEVDVVDSEQSCGEQGADVTKQQIVDEIEVLLGQLTNVRLAGLVLQTIFV